MSESPLVQALLYPKAVALIGASGTAGRLTARPQTFLKRLGFAGKVYPVNPSRDEVLGEKAWPSVQALPDKVQHAYVLLNGDPAVQAVRDCAAAGVRVVSVLADGFAEAGADGARRQQELVRIADDAGITLIGPNSTGVVEASGGFACTTNAAFAADTLPQGRFAVLSQSGSMIGAMLSRGQAVGLGFKAYVSVGNEANAGVGELGNALLEDSSIEGFVLFLETIRNPQTVAQFARRAQAAGKPVVAYLVGRSEAGKALAVSHTGAMVGGTRAMQAFLEASGVVIADGFEAMIEMTGALALRQRLAQRPKAATVLTTTGGGGGMVYDLIGLRGAGLQPIPESTTSVLAASGIEIKPGPLIDLTLAGTRYETMKAVVQALISDKQTGLVVAAIGSSAQFNPEDSVRPIVDAVASAGPDAAPVVAVPIPHAPQSIQLWNAGGVPAFRTPESCAEAVAGLLRPMPVADNTNYPLPNECVALIDRYPAGNLDELQAGEVLQLLGVRTAASVFVPMGDSVPDDIPFAAPWVLKVVCADLMHKSDAGGVRVGLSDPGELADAMVQMQANVTRHAPNATIRGFMIQQQVTGIGEVIVGMTRDPVVGPMISVGMGGVLTEIYQDIAMHPAPAGQAAALALFDQVKGFATLRGFRGKATGDLPALAGLVAAVSLLANHPRVEEAEINPVLIGTEGDGVVAVDALLRLS